MSHAGQSFISIFGSFKQGQTMWKNLVLTSVCTVSMRIEELKVTNYTINGLQSQK